MLIYIEDVMQSCALEMQGLPLGWDDSMRGSRSGRKKSPLRLPMLALVAVDTRTVGRNRVPEGESWLRSSSMPGWGWAGCVLSGKFLTPTLPITTREGAQHARGQSAGLEKEQGKLLPHSCL